MERPSIWLTLTILVYGIFGSYLMLLGSLFMRLTVPLSHFYNESLSAHYGVYIDEPGFIKVNSYIHMVGTVGQVLSTVFLLPRMDNFGRKTVIVYTAGILGILASLLFALSKYFVSIEMIVLSKFFEGFLMPVKIGLFKIYISECAPDSIRGFSTEAISAVTKITITTGFLFSLEQVFGTEDKWQYIGFVTLAMAVLFTIFASIIPESPKYLFSSNAFKKKLIEAIKKFHGKDVDTAEILSNFSQEVQLTNTSHTTFKQLLSDEGLRESFVLILILTLFQGISALKVLGLINLPLKIKLGFSNSTALLLDTGMAVLTIPFLCLLPYLLERVGRRRIFLTSMVFALLTLVTMVVAQISFDIFGPGWFTMSLAMIYTIFRMISSMTGDGTYGLMYIADLLPVSAKSVATQSVLLTNDFVGMGMDFLYPNLEPIVGVFFYAPVAVIQVAFFYYCFYNMPETRGKAVYQNYVQIKSRASSRRHSLLSGRSRSTTVNYGTQK